MLLLILCVSANVALAIIFKYFPRFNIRNLPAIVVSYMTCVVIASLLEGNFIMKAGIWNEPWFGYAILLSLLFITGFTLMGYAFQLCGISLTTIIQKMSILMSAVFGILYYSESFNLMKGLGLLFALIAIIVVNYDPKSAALQNVDKKHLLYPIIVLLFSGIIEILLLYVGVEGIVSNNLEFVSVAFGLAGSLGILGLLKHRPFITIKEILAGIVLGIPNFFTIYLLVVLIDQGWEGSFLFPVNSIGILIFAGLVGVFLFKEKPDKYMLIGFGAALLSILLLSQA